MPRTAVIVAGLLAMMVVAEAGADTEVGGNFRIYPFVFLEDVLPDRQYAQISLLRGELRSYLSQSSSVEVHAVIEASSPPAFGGAASIVSGATRNYFDLDTVLIDSEDLLAVGSIDRLNYRWDHSALRLTVGRQAITWGVGYFWPVLDLFAPFAPERIDRDYKPGVDALRGVVSLGQFSEVELVVAGQGRRLPEDFSIASLGRFHHGLTDFGYMAGRFHEDSVVGGFMSSDVRGSALRFEASYTDSGDERDDEIGRGSFWRATAGFDRQISSNLVLSAELHWNGFGADDPSGYARIAAADRVRRGEVTSLGRSYGGLSLAWNAHPLWTVSAALLTNWSDGSSLLQPSASWSTSDNSSVLLGLIVGVGAGGDFVLPEDPNDEPELVLGSEYGFVPATIWGAYKVYF